MPTPNDYDRRLFILERHSESTNQGDPYVIEEEKLYDEVDRY